MNLCLFLFDRQSKIYSLYIIIIIRNIYFTHYLDIFVSFVLSLIFGI